MMFRQSLKSLYLDCLITHENLDLNEGRPVLDRLAVGDQSVNWCL